MAYVDQTYYEGTYLGVAVDSTDFPRYELRAEEVIDLFIRGRIASGELASSPQAVQDAVRKAICAQIEYYVYNGLDVASAGVTSAGFTVGKVTVHAGTGSASKASTGAKTMISPQAAAFLEWTGLTNPAVGSAGIPGFWGWF